MKDGVDQGLILPCYIDILIFDVSILDFWTRDFGFLVLCGARNGRAVWPTVDMDGMITVQ
jgi:hypothetical protein